MSQWDPSPRRSWSSSEVSYAKSHDDLDRHKAFQAEAKDAALRLVETVRQIRAGRCHRLDEHLEAPRKQ